MTTSEAPKRSRTRAILDVFVYGIAVANLAMIPFQILGECRTSGLLFSIATDLFLVALALALLGWVHPPRRIRPILLAFVATCGNLFCLH